jgi:hypothetical protein
MWRAIVLFFVIVSIIGCSGAAYKGIDNADYGYQSKAQDNDIASDTRLIISSADLKMKSFAPDSLHNQVIDLANRYDGYILNSGKNFTDIRVPGLRYLEAITEIETLGETVEKKITGKDITEGYHDFELRLDNAEKTRLRYLALLERARII